MIKIGVIVCKERWFPKKLAVHIEHNTTLTTRCTNQHLVPFQSNIHRCTRTAKDAKIRKDTSVLDPFRRVVQKVGKEPSASTIAFRTPHNNGRERIGSRDIYVSPKPPVNVGRDNILSELFPLPPGK